MIKITHVSKSYNRGKVKAVDDLSLTVKPGEIFGFLGPNEAGKTTTIKMLVGVLRPDAGRVTIEGFDVATNPRCGFARILVSEGGEDREGRFHHVPAFSDGLLTQMFSCEVKNCDSASQGRQETEISIVDHSKVGERSYLGSVTVDDVTVRAAIDKVFGEGEISPQ